MQRSGPNSSRTCSTTWRIGEERQPFHGASVTRPENLHRVRGARAIAVTASLQCPKSTRPQIGFAGVVQHDCQRRHTVSELDGRQQLRRSYQRVEDQSPSLHGPEAAQNVWAQEPLGVRLVLHQVAHPS